MSLQNCGLSARSLAELALIVARVARANIDDTTIPSEESLRTFWQCGRSLEKRWMNVLGDWTSAGEFDVELLSRVAARLFACDLLVRTWSTTLAGIDRRTSREDMTPIARNVVNGLARVRNGVLARLLKVEVVESIVGIDRLRRRCERWTDVLVGATARRCYSFEFSYDPARARDFSDESFREDPATGPNAAEHFMSAGLRLNFIRNLPSHPVDEPELMGVVQSILTCIPDQAFHRDGSFRTLLEHRIAVSRQRIERRALSAMSPFDLIEDALKASMKNGVSKKSPLDK